MTAMSCDFPIPPGTPIRPIVVEILDGRITVKLTQRLLAFLGLILQLLVANCQLLAASPPPAPLPGLPEHNISERAANYKRKLKDDLAFFSNGSNRLICLWIETRANPGRQGTIDCTRLLTNAICRRNFPISELLLPLNGRSGSNRCTT
jgi:hypothetical protein